MSPEFRGGLTVAAVAGAFMAGYFLKPTPAIPTVVAQAPAPVPAAAPAAEVPLVIPPLDDQVKPAAAVNPNDPALKMIGDALGIKTTVIDKSEPLPAVLADALKEPVPMGGPMPRLEPPPVPPTPLVDELPVQRPAPCGTIRLTIRDRDGHVTTVNAADPVTIDLATDGAKPAGPEVGPMPRQVEARRTREGFPFRPAAGKTTAHVVVLGTTKLGIEREEAGLEGAFNAKLIESLDTRLKARGDAVDLVWMPRIEEYKANNPQWRTVHPCDFAKELGTESNYHIDVELQDFDLIKPGSRGKWYQGRATVMIAIYDLSKLRKEPVVKADLALEDSPADEIRVESKADLAWCRQRFVDYIAARVAAEILTGMRPADEPEAGPMPREVDAVPASFVTPLPALLGSPVLLK